MLGDLHLGFVGLGLEDLEGKLDVAGGGEDGQGECECGGVEDDASADEFSLDSFCHFIDFLYA